MFCKNCHGTGNGGECERCGGSGIEPKPARALTREEQINDFRVIAKGDLEKFKVLVEKRYGSDAVHYALDLFSNWTPLIA